MKRYPREVRDAIIKCLPCNAPAVRTTAGEYVCVECGTTVVSSTSASRPPTGIVPSVRVGE